MVLLFLMILTMTFTKGYCIPVHCLCAAGLKFFRSANNVILTEGNQDGAVAPDFFQKVVDRKSGKGCFKMLFSRRDLKSSEK